MGDVFTQRVRAAAVAAWWAILVVAVWMTVAWLAWLGIMSARPAWVLKLWGGADLTWEKVQTLVLTFWATFKLILITCVVVALWLTFWARQLRRQGRTDTPE